MPAYRVSPPRNRPSPANVEPIETPAMILDLRHLKHQFTLAVAGIGLAAVATVPFVITAQAG